MERLQSQSNAYFKLKAIRPTNLARNFPHSNPIPNFGHMPSDKYLVQKTSWYVSPFEGCTLENCTNDNPYNNNTLHDNTPDDNTINCQFFNCNVNDNNQSLDDCPDCLYLENLEAQKQLEVERAGLANARRGLCFGCNTNTMPNDNAEEKNIHEKNFNEKNFNENNLHVRGFDEKNFDERNAINEKFFNERAASNEEKASNEKAINEKAINEKGFYQRAFGGCGCRGRNVAFDGEESGVGEDQAEDGRGAGRGSSFGGEAPPEGEKKSGDFLVKEAAASGKFLHVRSFGDRATNEVFNGQREKATNEAADVKEKATSDKAVGDSPRSDRRVGFSSCINCCGMSNRVNQESRTLVDNGDNSASVTGQVEVNDSQKVGVVCNNPFESYDEKTKFIKQVFANASPMSSFENNFSKAGDCAWDYGSGVINFDEKNFDEKNFDERNASNLKGDLEGDEKATNEKASNEKTINEKVINEKATNEKVSNEKVTNEKGFTEGVPAVEQKISHLDRAVRLQDEEMQLRYQVTESLTKALLDMPVDDYIRVIKSVLDEVSSVAPD